MPSTQIPVRPWTPTERPDDGSHVSPVIYHGPNQLNADDDSEISAEDEPIFPAQLAAQARLNQLEAARVPLRFRSSQALRDDALESAPEGQLYKRYQASQEPEKPPRRHKSAKVPEGDRGDRLPANNPYRLSQALNVSVNQLRSSRSTEALQDALSPLIAPSPMQRPSTALPLRKAIPKLEVASADQDDSTRPQMKSAVPSIKVSDELPSVTGTSSRHIKILLINPNSTSSMTQSCLENLSGTLPVNITVSGFTAPHPSPTAIESQTDAILSTSICIRQILPIAGGYDAFLVACFSHHPLIQALRDSLTQPVIGIMEASLYAARMCGGKFGIVTTSQRSSVLHGMSMRDYGLDEFCVGTESTVGVLELEGKTRAEVDAKMGRAAKELQRKGADCICLGCAGMTGLKKVCKDAVGMEKRKAMIIDGVAVGVHFLVGLVREGLGTAKQG